MSVMIHLYDDIGLQNGKGGGGIAIDYLSKRAAGG